MSHVSRRPASHQPGPVVRLLRCVECALAGYSPCSVLATLPALPLLLSLLCPCYSPRSVRVPLCPCWLLSPVCPYERAVAGSPPEAAPRGLAGYSRVSSPLKNPVACLHLPWVQAGEGGAARGSAAASLCVRPLTGEGAPPPGRLPSPYSSPLSIHISPCRRGGASCRSSPLSLHLQRSISPLHRPHLLAAQARRHLPSPCSSSFLTAPKDLPPSLCLEPLVAAEVCGLLQDVSLLHAQRCVASSRASPSSMNIAPALWRLSSTRGAGAGWDRIGPGWALARTGLGPWDRIGTGWALAPCSLSIPFYTSSLHSCSSCLVSLGRPPSKAGWDRAPAVHLPSQPRATTRRVSPPFDGHDPPPLPLSARSSDRHSKP